MVGAMKNTENLPDFIAALQKKIRIEIIHGKKAQNIFAIIMYREKYWMIRACTTLG